MSAARPRKVAKSALPRRRSGNALHSISYRSLVLGNPVGLRIAGTPWWAICCLFGLLIVLMCLQTVFPQDSRDKVAWWIERWRSRQSRKRP